MTPTTDEDLQALGKQLPYEQPDRSRTESVRASLLAAAAHPAVPGTRRWLLVGGGFAAGVLAAAAVALVLLRPSTETSAPIAHEAYARIESSSAAELEHTMVPTATGTDELVRVRAGKVRLAVPPTRTGDRVRVTTGDAEIVGSGAYEVVVAADSLASVTVTSGTATLKLAGQQQAVFLAAGQTWRSTVQTADLIPAQPAIVANASTAPSGAPPLQPMPGTTQASPAPAPIADAIDDDVPPLKPMPAATSSRPIAPASRAKTPRSPRTTDSGAPIETDLAPDPIVGKGSVATKTVAPPTDTVGATEPDRAPRAAVTAPSENLSAGEPARAPTAASPTSETERHFRTGWSLLRANKLADAIIELDAAARGEGPLAADARYYQAVALIRAKRGTEAERALVQFLDSAPTSTRRGRAAIMLGRLITDRGDRAGARAWFELAARDSDPTVAAAGKAALK